MIWAIRQLTEITSKRRSGAKKSTKNSQAQDIAPLDTAT